MKRLRRQSGHGTRRGLNVQIVGGCNMKLTKRSRHAHVSDVAIEHVVALRSAHVHGKSVA
eukprot:scaffold52888_cov70-Phaeocystis_antarctica.AAC.11